MAKDNVELAYAMADAFRRGDWDAVAAGIDPNVLVRTDPRWPEQHIYGREATIDFYRGLREAGGPDLRIEEILDLGDRVLLRECWGVRGQQSGVEGEQHYTVIATVREGRFVLVEFFLEHEQALKAVGLAE
jgi:ketosteroid isomerase-like protein